MLSALQFIFSTASAANYSTSDPFDNLPLGPSDFILGVIDAFKRDPNPKKINLGVGAYRDDQGKPFMLPSVQLAEEAIINAKMDKEYSGIIGIPEFNELAAKLAFGEDSPVIKEKRNATVQSISGTGALNLGAEFLSKWYPFNKVIYLSNPPYGNHAPLLEFTGLTVRYYRYFDKSTCSFDENGCFEDISNIPERSIIMLHACAHNPTGVDPTPEQWKKISDIIKQRNLYVFFDMAYQGFASGDIHRDAFSVRYFAEQGHHLSVAQSFAKSMGLYGERVGTLTIVCKNQDEKARIMSQLKILIRSIYSNPPIHGPRIAAKILSDQNLYQQWLKDVKGMADRIITMRIQLKELLVKAGSQRKWSHIVEQIGMFCYTGISPDQVERLAKEYSIYLTMDGRISMAGVSSNNIEYLAHALHEVTNNCHI